jgi:hypothetical protein
VSVALPHNLITQGKPMDLNAATTAFATIVSLIADFKAHRDANQSTDYEEFAKYLATHRHEEISGLLSRNSEITLAIKALLKEDRDVLRQRFDKLDMLLAAIASRMEGFAPLAEALYPSANVSAQAVSILKQFRDASASKAIDVGVHGRGPVYLLADGRQGELEFQDMQFVVDDFMRLCELGFLRADTNSTGKRVYLFTRAGAQFLAATEASDP